MAGQVYTQRADKEFYTVKEAANILRMSVWSVWKLAGRPKKERPPVLRVGASIRFPAQEFDEWKKGK